MNQNHENETEYDYNLGQGRTVKQLDCNISTGAWIISLILTIGLGIIVFIALKPFFA